MEVPYSDVARGFEAPGGRVVVLTDADLADLPLPTARSIEVLGVVPAETVDPVVLDRAYYLGASGLEGRPYVLLREALAESGLVGIARTALLTRESLAVLRVREDVLCLQGLLWPDEIRPSQAKSRPMFGMNLPERHGARFGDGVDQNRDAHEAERDRHPDDRGGGLILIGRPTSAVRTSTPFPTALPAYRSRTVRRALSTSPCCSGPTLPCSVPVSKQMAASWRRLTATREASTGVVRCTLMALSGCCAGAWRTRTTTEL